MWGADLASPLRRYFDTVYENSTSDQFIATMLDALGTIRANVSTDDRKHPYLDLDFSTLGRHVHKTIDGAENRGITLRQRGLSYCDA